MPQVVVDGHEMGSFDTYLFNPPREPVNPHINESIRRWWRVFAKDQARAFDRYGWSYYTREWLEDWYPGYTTSWTACIGAVAILYEQAYTGGARVKRPDGTLLTFREAVHHHFTSSMANLTTAADNRKALLADFRKMREAAVEGSGKDGARAYYINPARNPSRARRLVERLLMQGIEVEVAEKEFRVRNCTGYRDTELETRTFPPGTYIIRLDQPLRPLVEAILEFDPRLSTEFLATEREHLEKGKGTRMYEVSTWSMLLAYDVDAWASREIPGVETRRITEVRPPEGGVAGAEPLFGYLVDFRDDNAVDALVAFLERGYKVRAARKPFTVEGKSFPRGSLLLRLNENPPELHDEIPEIARSAHVVVHGVNTALSDEGPDLGGREFRLLVPPKIGILAGPALGTYSFGSLWHFLDRELRCRYSILNYHGFGGLDLRKYNVLILPSGSPQTYRAVLGSNMKKLKDWIANGGTLIAVGGASAFCADSAVGLSRVRLRRQVLDDLDAYRRALERERTAGKTRIDSLAIWEGKVTEEKEEGKEEKKAGKKPTPEELKELDRRQRLFYPRGTILRADLDEEHWLNFGMGKKLPVIVNTTYAYLSKEPVQTAARFSEGSRLRISGLLWPEARDRWRDSACVTRESMGKGQVILFAGEPCFRSYFYGTARILANALLLGPGFGTQPVVEW